MSRSLEGYVLFLALIAIVGSVICFVVYATLPLEYTMYSPVESTQLKEAYEHSLSFGIAWGSFTFAIVVFFWEDLRKRHPQPEDILTFIKSSFSRIKQSKMLLVYVSLCTFISLPWILAFVGIFVSDIPGLSLIFLSKQPWNGYPAVHLGSHHGLTGYMLSMLVPPALYFLAKKREKSQWTWFKIFTLWSVLLLGQNHMWEDFINEQIYKRGIPFLIPTLRESTPWMLVVYIVGGIIATLLQYRREKNAKSHTNLIQS